MKRKALTTLAALALATSACGARQADTAQVNDDAPSATVASTTTTLSSPTTSQSPTTVEQTTTVTEETTDDIIVPSPSIVATPDADPSESLAMTADEIAELEAELDAIDALLVDLDSSFDAD